MAKPRELIRRLRADDHRELAELCRQDKRWPRYFDRHEVWLTRALEDVKKPGRAVFGFFSPVLRPARLNFSNQLDACLFLKPSEFDISAELKNPVLREGDGETFGEALELRLRPLVQKAVRHCEVRDIAKLEIELPQNEHELVSLFLKMDFRVVAIRERYRPSLPICILERTLGEVYHADPFAVESMAFWLIRGLLSASSIEKSEYSLNGTIVPRLRFEGKPRHQAFARKDSATYDRRLIGSMLILDEGDCDDASVRWICKDNGFRREQLRYILAQKLSDAARKALSEIGAVAFEFKDLDTMGGSQKSSLGMPFIRSDVGGIVTVLEEERVNEYKSFKVPWVYYLLSGLGEALDMPKEGPSDLLAIFCPNWKASLSGIVGVAEIEEKETMPVKDAAQAFPGSPRALSQDDLSFYMSRSDQELVTVLLCRPVVPLGVPIEIEDSSVHSAPEELNYITGALDEMNSAYFSRDFASILRERMDTPNETNQFSNDNQSSSSTIDLAKQTMNSAVLLVDAVIDAVVITVREDETDAVLSKATGCRTVVGRHRTYSVGTVYRDHGTSLSVAFVKTSEQGPIAAQDTARDVIEDLDPGIIFLVGIAGAVPEKEFTLGDVIIGSRLHDFSVGAYVESRQPEFADQGGPMSKVSQDLANYIPMLRTAMKNWQLPEVIGVARPTVTLESTRFYGDDAWRQTTYDGLTHNFVADGHRNHPIATVRAIASSGFLIKDTRIVSEWRQAARDVMAVEMELSGVYSAANRIKKQYPVVAIRGISDVVGFRRSPEWTAYACRVAASFCFELLKHAPEHLLRPSESRSLTSMHGHENRS